MWCWGREGCAHAFMLARTLQIPPNTHTNTQKLKLNNTNQLKKPKKKPNKPKKQGHHERAVLYFQRALKLNRRFLFAWTLMGHGFLEMKNTGAAIEVRCVGLKS